MTVEMIPPHVKDGKNFFINDNKEPKSQNWDSDTPEILINFQVKSGFLQSSGITVFFFFFCAL